MLVGDVSKFGCTVSWEPPESDGGSPITSYIVELRDRTSVKWSPVHVTKADELSAIINDVIENKEYIFRVRAENKAGVGMPSAASQPVKIMDAIGALVPQQTCSERLQRTYVLLFVCRAPQPPTEPGLAGPEQELCAAYMGDASEQRRQHDHWVHHRALRGRNRQVASL